MSSEFNKMSDKQRAISALKSLTLQRFDLEKEEEICMYNVQLEFQKKFEILQEKQYKIIHGADITEADCDKYLSLKDSSSKENENDSIFKYESHKGFKNFWLNVLKNSKHTQEMIQPVDEPIFEYLTNVTVKQIDPTNPFPDYPDFTTNGIILEFHFNENPYFTNRTLYKYFKLEARTDPENPFDYEGFVPVHVEYSEINWNPGKNVTVREIKKTQKNKKTKQVRTVHKTEKVESFFNFFSIIKPDDIAENDNEIEFQLIHESIMISEYDLISHIQSEIIPKAILYYLGEVYEDDDDDDEDDEECSDESDDDDDLPLKFQNRRRGDGFLSTSPRHK